MKVEAAKKITLFSVVIVAAFMLSKEAVYWKNECRQILFSYLFPVQYYVESQYVDCDFRGDPGYRTNPEVAYIVMDEETVAYIEETEEEMDEEPLVETAVVPNSVMGKIMKNDLLDFKKTVSNYYTVTSITELTEQQFDIETALNQSLQLKRDENAPQILIFHTHSQEGFVDSVPGDANTTIVGVGSYLADILANQYGYQVIHDTTVYDYVGGVLDRSKAYTYAEQGIEKILEQYPTIEVILDIHRDGVNDNVHLKTEVNGKPTARFMFFNGISHTKVNGDIEYLKNPYIQENLAMSLQMYLMGESLYPGLLRKNYINGYRYCLHFRPRSMLIEVGAQNNTLEEELNAMEPLADMLNRVLSGQKAYE